MGRPEIAKARFYRFYRARTMPHRAFGIRRPAIKRAYIQDLAWRGDMPYLRLNAVEKLAALL